MENYVGLSKNAILVLKAQAKTNCRCGDSCARTNSPINCIRIARESALKQLGELGISLESDNSHYSVYVVELSKDVMRDNKFQKRNPRCLPNSMCVYVGMTGLKPDERFAKHKLGIKANSFVQKYGIRLLPGLYKKYNPMSYNDAVIREVKLAEELKIKGYCVYQA